MPLQDVITRVQAEIRDVGIGINEADARTGLIAPILSALGWEGLARIRSEYSVDRGQMRWDYALLDSNGSPVGVIEAKAPREDLATHIDQPLTYAARKGVDFCVLTSGVLWWLYLPRERGDPAQRRFAAIDLRVDDVQEVTAILESCLRYEVLIGGAGEKHARGLLEALRLEQLVRSEIPRAWRRLLEGPNEMLVELVQEDVEAAIGERPAYEFVKSELSKIVVPRRTEATTERQGRTPTLAPLPVAPAPTTSQQTRQASSTSAGRPTGIRLKGEHRRVANTWNDALYQLAVLILQRHPSDFDRVLDWSGPNRPYVVLNKEDVPRTRRPKRIADSPYHLDMNWSSSGVKARVQELLRLFDYASADFEFEFD
ncbi:MAG: hypothetical protein OXS30_02895 [Chloroflexota bacterium]|nr:hypothetical protein [Chloroflexota bacterium]